MAQHVSTQFTNKIRNPSFNVIGASRFIYKRSRETKRNNFTMSEKNLAPVSSAVSTDTDVTSLDMQGLDAGDAALHQKIKLINDAIDEIGFTPYHFKLFCLSGMGYATDSQLTFIESSVRTFVNYQFGYTYPVSSQCLYFGMLLGTLFWGFGADLIGRISFTLGSPHDFDWCNGYFHHLLSFYYPLLFCGWRQLGVGYLCVFGVPSS